MALLHMHCCTDPSIMSSLSESTAVQGSALLFRRVHPRHFTSLLPCSKFTPHFHRIGCIEGKYFNHLHERTDAVLESEVAVQEKKKRRINIDSSASMDNLCTYLKPSNVVLSVHVIEERYLTPQDVLGCYINNTNLNRLPSKCLGVLVAFSLQDIKPNEKSNLQFRCHYLPSSIFHHHCTHHT